MYGTSSTLTAGVRRKSDNSRVRCTGVGVCDSRADPPPIATRGVRAWRSLAPYTAARQPQNAAAVGSRQHVVCGWPRHLPDVVALVGSHRRHAECCHGQWSLCYFFWSRQLFTSCAVEFHNVTLAQAHAGTHPATHHQASSNVPKREDLLPRGAGYRAQPCRPQDLMRGRTPASLRFH